MVAREFLQKFATIRMEFEDTSFSWFATWFQVSEFWRIPRGP